MRSRKTFTPCTTTTTIFSCCAKCWWRSKERKQRLVIQRRWSWRGWTKIDKWAGQARARSKCTRLERRSCPNCRRTHEEEAEQRELSKEKSRHDRWGKAKTKIRRTRSSCKWASRNWTADWRRKSTSSAWKRGSRATRTRRERAQRSRGERALSREFYVP